VIAALPQSNHAAFLLLPVYVLQFCDWLIMI